VADEWLAADSDARSRARTPGCPTIHQLRRRAHYLAHMPRRGRSLRARALAWWRRSHADPERRAFRRIGVIAFGFVGGSVILAKVTQDAPGAGPIRAFAVAMFGLGAITLLEIGRAHV